MSECSICFEPYVHDRQDHDLNPMVVCRQGHCCCCRCAHHLRAAGYTHCPTCKRETLLDTPVRHRLLEPVTESVAASATATDPESVAASATSTATATAPERATQLAAVTTLPIVLLVDHSGSMNDTAMDDKVRTNELRPNRLELAAHMTKIMHAYCRHYQIPLHVHTFANELHSSALVIPPNSTTTDIDLNVAVARWRANGCTYLDRALTDLYHRYRDGVHYFLFTDGAPSDSITRSLDAFVNASLHVFAFSNKVKADALRDVVARGGHRHTISYIQDMRSLFNYMISIFAYVISDFSRAELSEADEALRAKYVEMLEPQVCGHRTAAYSKEALLVMCRDAPSSDYSRALILDTYDERNVHGRVFYSFDPSNWNSFGQYYLPCILHAHTHRIPINGYDNSLTHYCTREVLTIKNNLANMATSIPLDCFVPRESRRNDRSATVTAPPTAEQQRVANANFQTMIARGFSYSSDARRDNYNDNDGCIAGDAEARMVDGTWKCVRDLCVHDQLFGGARITHILAVSHLVRRTLLPLFHDLTANHPVVGPDQTWCAAHTLTEPTRYVPEDMLLYDFALDDGSRGMTIRATTGQVLQVATLGVAIPGMEHALYGTSLILTKIDEFALEPHMAYIRGDEFVQPEVDDAYSVVSPAENSCPREDSDSDEEFFSLDTEESVSPLRL